MKFNLDVKTLVFIISTSCVLGGFYYTTQARLDSVEIEILDAQQQIGTLKGEVKRLNKSIRNLRKQK